MAEIIESQFDLAAQEARELARRATLAPSDAEGPEPEEHEVVGDATKVIKPKRGRPKKAKAVDPAAGDGVGAGDGTAEQGESTQAP